MVQHVVVIHNTGNVRLRGVDISTTLSRASVPVLTPYMCTGGDNDTLPSSLNVSSSMTCIANYTFDAVTDIEAGDLNFTATVQATNLGPAVTAQPETQVLRVINAPSVQLTLNASACDAPSVYSKCPYSDGWGDLWAGLAPVCATGCRPTLLVLRLSIHAQLAHNVLLLCACCRSPPNLHARPDGAQHRQHPNQLHLGDLYHSRRQHHCVYSH